MLNEHVLLIESLLTQIIFFAPWVLVALFLQKQWRYPFLLFPFFTVVISSAAVFLSLQVRLFGWPVLIGSWLAAIFLMIQQWKYRPVWRRPSKWFVVGASCYFIVFLFMCFMELPKRGLLFPQTLCDVSLGHLTVPLAHLSQMSWVNSWWTRIPWIPQLGHSVTLGLAWTAREFWGRGDIAPVFFQQLLLFSMLIQVWREMKEWSFFFILMVLSVPLIFFQSTLVYSDILAIFLLFTMFLLIDQWRRTGDSQVLSWAVFLGIVSYTGKHQAGMFAVVPWIAVSLTHFKKLWHGLLIEIKKKHFWFLLVGGLLILMLYTFRNAQLAGNPLFPFGPFKENKFFWDIESATEFKNAVSYYIPKNWVQSLFVYESLSSTINFRNDSIPFGLGLWWFPITLFPFFAILWSIRKKVPKEQIEFLVYTVFCAVIFYIIWLRTSPVFRYITPLVVILLFALLRFSLEQSNLKLRQGLLAAIGFLMIASWIPLLSRVNIVSPPTSKAEVANFVLRNVRGGKSFAYLQEKTPEDTVVLSVLASCSNLYSPRPTVGDWYGLAKFTKYAGRSREDTIEFMSKMDFDYAVFVKSNPYWNAQAIFRNYEDCVELILDTSTESLFKFLKKPACRNGSVEVLPEMRELRNSRAFSITPFWR